MSSPHNRRRVFVFALVCFFTTISSHDAKSVPTNNKRSSINRYDPFPPPPDQQIVYSFSPLDFNPEAQSRATRDLSWRSEDGGEDDDLFFTSSSNEDDDEGREPTCEELRKMWRIARNIHQRSLETNEIPQEMHEFLSFADSSSSSSNLNGNANEDESLRADRRRMSVPTLRNLKPKPVKTAVSKVVSDAMSMTTTTTEKPSRSTLKVRDPAKEIYGFLREHSPENDDDDSSSSNNIKNEDKEEIYGTVHSHAPENGGGSSYLDLVRDELLPGGRGQAGHSRGESDNFGVVRYHQRKPASSSPFDVIRGRVRETAKEEEDPFEVIRQRLMNTRSRLNSGSKKGFRRKSGDKKHRRRNVSTCLRINTCTMCVIKISTAGFPHSR